MVLQHHRRRHPDGSRRLHLPHTLQPEGPLLRHFLRRTVLFHRGGTSPLLRSHLHHHHHHDQPRWQRICPTATQGNLVDFYLMRHRRHCHPKPRFSPDRCGLRESQRPSHTRPHSSSRACIPGLQLRHLHHLS